jgi:hypothetical protein
MLREVNNPAMIRKEGLGSSGSICPSPGGGTFLTHDQKSTASIGQKQENETYILRTSVYLFIFIFWWDWGLKSGLHTCKAGTLPPEPHL